MTFQKNRFGGIFESYKENFGEFYKISKLSTKLAPNFYELWTQNWPINSDFCHRIDAAKIGFRSTTFE